MKKEEKMSLSEVFVLIFVIIALVLFLNYANNKLYKKTMVESYQKVESNLSFFDKLDKVMEVKKKEKVKVKKISKEDDDFFYDISLWGAAIAIILMLAGAP